MDKKKQRAAKDTVASGGSSTKGMAQADKARNNKIYLLDQIGMDDCRPRSGELDKQAPFLQWILVSTYKEDVQQQH